MRSYLVEYERDQDIKYECVNGTTDEECGAFDVFLKAF